MVYTKFDQLYEEVMTIHTAGVLDESLLSKSLDVVEVIGNGFSYLKKLVSKKKPEVRADTKRKGMDVMFTIDEYMEEADKLVKSTNNPNIDVTIDKLEEKSSELLVDLSKYFSQEEVDAMQKSIDTHFEKIRSKMTMGLKVTIGKIAEIANETQEVLDSTTKLGQQKIEQNKKTLLSLLKKAFDEWNSLKGVDLGTKVAYALLMSGLVKKINF